MIIFLDTEYTDFVDIDLISIGMVSEDGQRELYIERTDYREDWCNAFVQAAVLPQLDQTGLDRNQLADRLRSWFSTLPRRVVVACDSFTDWELLLDAFGDDPPANLTGRYDLRTLVDSAVFHAAVVHYYENYGPWHHALHDARAHRRGWLAWNDSQKKK